MSSDELDGPKEKTRICPSCRMQISVLAVKCRFCGEEVGKPKEEQRSLSISDLGGETIHHRAPSGSVMEALESFRAETGEGVGESALPDDIATQAMSDFDVDDAVFGGTARKEQEASRQHQVQQAKRNRMIQIVAAVLVLAIAAIAVPMVLRNLNEKEAVAGDVVFVNRAPAALADGQYLEALELATNAVQQDNSPDNRRILDEVVTALSAQVSAKMEARSGWTSSSLREAVALAENAAKMYPNEVTENTRARALEENTAYNIVLVSIDGDEAVFQLPSSRDTKYRVKKGDVFYDDRFSVEQILAGTNQVFLRDTERNDRRLRVRLQGTPTER